MASMASGAASDRAPADDSKPMAAASGKPERARWNSPMEFTITCIGYAVGLGNFWRFPYLCYTYGGGAFLVPYTLVLCIIGVPVFLLELGVGQKAQVGATCAWSAIHPALGGIGYSGVTATFFVALYYNVIVAWAIWFLINSFRSPLPWADEPASLNASTSNGSDSNVTRTAASAALRYFEVDSLHCRGERDTCSWADIDSDEWSSLWPRLFDAGGLVPELVLCLAISWFLIWLCVCKGIESLGKVAWFTAIFPYFVLAILLGRGLTLPGASLCLSFYLPSFYLSSFHWFPFYSSSFYSSSFYLFPFYLFPFYSPSFYLFVQVPRWGSHST